MAELTRDPADTLLADNRKAGFDYHLLETFEAGIALRGTEVKAIREGRANLREAYCRLERGEAYLFGAHVGQYSHGGSASHDPERPRKLLLKRAELNKLLGKTTEKGLTIVPLRLYLKKGRVKVAVALARGKKTYDKRETIRRREADRETRAAVKTRRV
jgi:SsrA-binding protein